MICYFVLDARFLILRVASDPAQEVFTDILALLEMGGAQQRGDSDQGLSIPPLSLVAMSSTEASHWPMFGESVGVYKTGAAQANTSHFYLLCLLFPGSGCYGRRARDGRRRYVTIKTQVSSTLKDPRRRNNRCLQNIIISAFHSEHSPCRL